MSSSIEEQVKQKLDGLEALDAGIVYGKEDAWDKLQQRMDKPARTIPLLTWKRVAVAAILLIVCTVGYWLANIGNEVKNEVVHASTPSIIPPAGESVGVMDSSTPATSETPTIAVSTMHPARSRNKKPVRLPSVPQIPKPIAAEEYVKAPEAERIDKIPEKPQPMRVVHINELNKQEQPQPIAVKETPQFPHVQFKMKVVHINELYAPVRQEDYMREAEQNTVIRMPFSQQKDGKPFELFRINLSKK